MWIWDAFLMDFDVILDGFVGVFCSDVGIALLSFLKLLRNL